MPKSSWQASCLKHIPVQSKWLQRPVVRVRSWTEKEDDGFGRRYRSQPTRWRMTHAHWLSARRHLYIVTERFFLTGGGVVGWWKVEGGVDIRGKLLMSSSIQVDTRVMCTGWPDDWPYYCPPSCFINGHFKLNHCDIMSGITQDRYVSTWMNNWWLAASF